MTYVVTEPCIGCRFAECVEVCPVEAFHAGPNFMVIDPERCINCAICEMVCPVEAIVADLDLAADVQEYRALNARLAGEWPVAQPPLAPLPCAEEMAARAGKRAQLQMPSR